LPLAQELCLLVYNFVWMTLANLMLPSLVFMPQPIGHLLRSRIGSFDDLQAVISSAPPDDLLLVMGDFNARVGCGEVMGSSCLKVRGMFGVGILNENGEHLLSFCALNKLCVMNTMFAKKKIHQYTWQHPGTKVWHCIDYILTCHSQRRYCIDATVFRSVDWFVLH